ncbi:MAG TPA: pseudouridine synthase [Aestuariivirgaceae bacterium]|jgi:23S rRNA pseudouridine2605 synthase
MPEKLSIAAREGERIAKLIARAGLCSRRDAEKLIAQGRVKLNGMTIRTPAVKISSGDNVEIDGRPLPQKEPTRLWRYHKPPGLIVSHRDPRGRPTIFDALPKGLPRVLSIGRLDFNTEGLMLLTNDGALERRLELPATGWTRRYRVRVHGDLDERALAKLQQGIVVDGVRYAPVDAEVERRQGDNAWLSFALKEGKNREIRRICEHLSLQVNRLIRVAFGPFQLGALGRSEVKEVPERVLREQLGSLLKDEAS